MRGCNTTCTLHVSPGLSVPLSGITVMSSQGATLPPPSVEMPCRKDHVAGISFELVSCIVTWRLCPQNTGPNLRLSLDSSMSGMVTLAFR